MARIIVWVNDHMTIDVPVITAIIVIMLAMSLIIVIVGYLGFRLLSRGEAGNGLAALTAISGET